MGGGSADAKDAKSAAFQVSCTSAHPPVAVTVRSFFLRSRGRKEPDPAPRPLGPGVTLMGGESGDLMCKSGAGVRHGADRGVYQRWVRLTHPQVPIFPPHETCTQYLCHRNMFCGALSEIRSEYSWQQPNAL